MSTTIRIQVIYALPALQVVRKLTLASGATARAAVLESRLPDEFPQIAVETSPLACFGILIDWNTVLADGDRVEILRPLLSDPKESRRRRAHAQASVRTPKKQR